MSECHQVTLTEWRGLCSCSTACRVLERLGHIASLTSPNVPALKWQQEGAALRSISRAGFMLPTTPRHGRGQQINLPQTGHSWSLQSRILPAAHAKTAGETPQVESQACRHCSEPQFAVSLPRNYLCIFGVSRNKLVLICRKPRVETVLPQAMAAQVFLLIANVWLQVDFKLKFICSDLFGKVFPNVLLSMGINAHFCLKTETFLIKGTGTSILHKTSQTKIHFSYYEHEKKEKHSYINMIEQTLKSHTKHFSVVWERKEIQNVKLIFLLEWDERYYFTPYLKHHSNFHLP